jgi:hypothetical protein
LASTVQRELANEGKLEPGTSLKSVLQLARFLRRTTDTVIVPTGGGDIVLPTEREDDVVQLLARVRGAVTHFEIARIGDLWNPVSTRWNENELRALQETLLPELCHLMWLDRSRHWFCLADSPPGCLLNRAAKLLSVCPRVKCQSFWRAIHRDPQIRSRIPPLPVLTAFCRNRPEFHREGDWISLCEPPSIEDSLGPLHGQIIAYLASHKPYCELSQLQLWASSVGISRRQLQNALWQCPAVKRYGGQRYGLF